MDDKPEGYSADNGHGRPTHLRKRSGEWIKTPPGYKTRDDGLPSHVWTKYEDEFQWVETPTLESLEHWSYDSVCETPDGDEVEPDHPRSWLRILGMI